MTEPSIYVEDVSKLKDADELKQAYIGLKDTNRYFAAASATPLFLVVTFISVEFTLSLLSSTSIITLEAVCVCMHVCALCL